MLKKGDKVPNFSVQNQKGETISNTHFNGKKWVIYFYPKDMTPGCTIQACNIRDNYATLKNEGITILGVSMDSESKHQRFIEKYDLPFDLLVDDEKKVLNAFGAFGPKKFMGRTYDGIHRVTFIIQDQEIIDVIEKPKVKDHSKEIIESFKNNS